MQHELHSDHREYSYRQGLDVVVEGRAERVTDRPTLERLAEVWQSKLGWPWDIVENGFRPQPEGPQPENADPQAVVPVFALRPSKVLSLGRGERRVVAASCRRVKCALHFGQS